MPITIDGDGGISGLELSDFGDVTGTPANGQFLAWNSSTGKWEPTTMTVKEKRIAAFTANGTWTVPADVTYAIAHMKGAGGGIGTTNGGAGGAGGASSVAFSGGTVSATGGNGGAVNRAGTYRAQQFFAGVANSGEGARGYDSGSEFGVGGIGGEGATIVAADTVTPGASITVTVGAGGSAGVSGQPGGSGYVYIEYYE